MAEALLLACHLLLALALIAASLSHLLAAAVAHLSPAHTTTTTTNRLRLLRHPLLRLLPVLAALPFPFLPVAPTSRLLPFLILPPLLLPLPLPFLHLPPLTPLFLSLPLLLLARAAGLLAAAFPASDLQAHALSVAALLLAAAGAASLLAALSPPRTAHHFLAQTAFAFAGTVGGLWALQTGLTLYVDACVPVGCHRLIDAALAPATRCDVEDARLQGVAVMDLMLSVHCLVAVAAVAGLYLGVAKCCGVDAGGRRQNGAGGSYEALPMVTSSGAIQEMEHLPMMKGVVGKAVAQE
ncbi:uncharacterized protein LOC124659903 [Lolium rigidum]|uniref:uncharacterized protein LOC124659903 n=1 Tax=Lolium rigidum TaxID=89674 RepID=UPI001F5E023C|nr:uncharacterized protein LOC124659903 [Lolium rigidum]